MQMKYSHILIFSVIAVIISDIILNIENAGQIDIGKATYIKTLLAYTVIIILLINAFKSKSKKNVPAPITVIFIAWIFVNLANIIRGFFLAGNYWDWKYLLLNAIGFSAISLVFYAGNSLVLSKKIFNFYLKYVFLFGFLIIPLALLADDHLYSRIMLPVSFFILCIPYLKKKWSVLIVIVSVVSILMAISFRANIIKIAFPLVLLVLYYLRNYISKIQLKFIFGLIFLAPLIFFYLGISGKYNLFEQLSENENYSYDNENYEDYEQNILADTRTFLYIEVFDTLLEAGALPFGVSAAKGYKSIWFFDTGGAIKGIRYDTEVNFLNIILHFGVLGIVVYFLLLLMISYYAIFRSNNALAMMIGFVIAFRWSFSFLEEYTQFDLNFFFFWLFAGLVSNSNFRAMSDEQMMKYLRK